VLEQLLTDQIVLLRWTRSKMGSSGGENITGTPLTERWEAVLRALASEAQLERLSVSLLNPERASKLFSKTGCAT